MSLTKAKQIARGMRRKGKSWQEVADELNRNNLLTRSGRPFSYGTAHELLYKRPNKNAPKAVKRKTPVRKRKDTTGELLDLVAEVITNPSFDNAVKLEFVKRLLA